MSDDRSDGVAAPLRKRKLIEVALPLEAINRESAREKSIRHGHPSTLHLWWSRKPLATARAVLFAQLVDDPSSRPDLYPTDEAQDAKRKELFELIEALVKWENTTDEALLKRAHAEILASTDGNPPAILDPFAGGGSIPLEAQRLGLEAHASDLNPVAVLINKALIEIPPKWAGRPPVFPGAAESRLGDWPRATGLAEDVRRYGQWMRDEAEKRIGHLYPKAKLPDGTEANVIAWIWCRTVTCPNPACGIEMPLYSKRWLGKKKGKEAWVRPVVRDGRVEFEIGHGTAGAPSKADDGTVSRTGAVCVACRTAVPLTYIRAEGAAKRMGARLMATAAEGHRQRIYLPPVPEHEAAARVPTPAEAPDTELSTHPQYMGVPRYGMTTHGDLFTLRQLTALITFSDLVMEVRTKVVADALAAGLERGDTLEGGGLGAVAYADSIAVYLGFVLSRLADIGNRICAWEPIAQCPRHLFGRQAIGMTWDFAEGAPLGDSSGSWAVLIEGAERAMVSGPFAPGTAVGGRAHQADATRRTYHDAVVSTDPPYYDNVPYADLSDFFYVWLRRSLGSVLTRTLSTVLTPKADELVADQHRLGGKAQATDFFERGFIRVFDRIRGDIPHEYPMTVFYAFKQSETDEGGTASTGWEVLLQGMVRTGWCITATWPMRTENASRLRGQASNALASSIVLSCRPRPRDAEATSRRGFLAALAAELPSALKELQLGSIAPVDLAQAAIGPGMAVFSRYSKVIEADGADMTVRTALALINHVLDEVLTEQEGDFDADTRFCIAWFAEFGWNTGPFGRADDLARAKNTSVDGLVRGGVFKAAAGKAGLIAPEDLRADWDPVTDVRTSAWEGALHLARTLAERGIDDAAALMGPIGQRMDLDTVKELAYYLYTVCERRGWTSAALLFNGLGTSWLDIESAARQRTAPAGAQGTLDLSGTQ